MTGKPVNDPRPPRALILVENLSVPFDRRVWREALSLRDAGWKVSVISPRGLDRDAAPREVLDGVEVHRFRLFEAGGGLKAYLLEYGLALMSMFWLALRVWRRTGFDVVQICNPPDLLIFAVLPFRLLGKKIIFDHHDLSPELYISKGGRAGSVLHRALLVFERITLRMADVIMSTNESYRRIAMDRGGRRAEEVFVVRNGPELSRLRCAAPDPALMKGAAHLLVYVGMMGNQDGVDYLLRAVAILAGELGRGDFHVALVGDGPAAPDLKGLARELGIADRVSFTGLVGQEEVFAAIATASVCLCPDPNIGLNDLSTLVKVLEYMGMARPVVAFDLTETRASAGDAALYATPNDERDFARHVDFLLDHPDEAARIGEIGRKRILDGLAWDHQAGNLLAAYRRAREGAAS